MLTTRLVTTSEELATLEAPWNALAEGNPFRSWNWLATWWKHYGTAADRELRVIALFNDGATDAGSLVGVAPWYLDRSMAGGNVLRPLGSGEVCTDHLSLICSSQDIARVATALAEHLSANDQWDRLELPAVDANDAAIGQLVAELEAHDSLVSRHQTGNCWVIELPDTWDEYVASLSRSHRRQLRCCHDELVKSGRSHWHRVKSDDEIEEAWKVLVDLHQRRRNSLGESGCFASTQFRDFHREVVKRLFAAGQLRLSWLELDGTPFATDYHLVGPTTLYTYQSGIDTNRLNESPGRLAYMLTIQRAIEEGIERLDFLRGDEPYKAHWRAEPQPIYDYRVLPNRRLARLRGHMMQAARTLKDWMKQGVASVCG